MRAPAALLCLCLCFALQGFLTPLLSPWPPPDLLLVAVLLPLGRPPLWRVVALTYLVGGVQDLAGGGVLGLHALALAAGVFLAGLALPGYLELGRAGLDWQSLALAAAFVGKGAALVLVLTFLGQPAPLAETLRVLPPEALLTFSALAFVHPLIARLTRRSERRLYG